MKRFKNGRRACVLAVMTAAITAAVLLQAGCASAPQGSASAPKGSADSDSVYPAKIAEWLDSHQDDSISGIGVANIDGDESFATREANTLARIDLTNNIEITVATISTNLDARLREKGQSAARAGKAIEAGKGAALQTITGAKTVGPVKNDGKIYVVKYIARDGMTRAQEKAVAKELEVTEAELNKMLGF